MSNRLSMLEEVIRPAEGNLEVALAKFVLSLKFSDEQIARYELLSEKVQDITLANDE